MQVTVHHETSAERNCMRAESEWEGKLDDHENHPIELKWSQGDSQYLLDSQQLVEGISLCEDLLQSQSSSGGIGGPRKDFSRLSDYARLGPEDLKKDLEECQKLSHFDHADIELDTPPEFRLSQLVCCYSFHVNSCFHVEAVG